VPGERVENLRTENKMSKITTGVGLCALALSIVAFPIIDRVLPRAEATVPAAAVQAIASAAHAQAGGEPTVVWYGTYGGYNGFAAGAIFRAWSDGTIEMKKLAAFSGGTSDACSATAPCSSPWLLISSPTQGFKAAADINADEKVDGSDLTAILAAWGDAPRVPFPPSDCPLNLVNP